ncbi:MBL fold metallo-hydrolase [Pontibacter sp. SGAir0037]|uniref:MBL fold metallo-hydrolase n=1 Tax=Pontibacter sp. SGAir0037 TaxID=2571030 RepID=UPI0010CCFFBA|nr:MBL fold metallo-hydrolase [Pontibacter sp. SGAir0037]QCR21190.1 MBL fold metallo-hydrolase [Pontibacter sp. SGAir0037]
MEETINNNTKAKHTFAVAPGVWGVKTVLVNLYLVGDPAGSWVLIDAGVYGAYSKIKKAVAEVFGKNSRPKAILLTHGHFDHIGAVKELAEEWEVPVYAHPLEMPYLTGQSSYPPPDPSVGGGGMAYMSFLYPKKPINIINHVELLPEDGSVPVLPDWQWIHTPGHTAGHVSFYRESDKVLIAGDAFVTRHGESAIAVMMQKREVHGPPMYYTSDWVSAHHSVRNLASLQIDVAATGHGLPMRGAELRTQLDQLVQDFWAVAVPSKGRYTNEPAITDEQGVISVPPPVSSPVTTVLLAAGAIAIAGTAYAVLSRNKRAKRQHMNNKRTTFSHNRVAEGIPPTIDPDFDDPTVHTNNYP